ncbi:hypothetical protein GQ44DRAFT_203275 [Phaeosphaeriaceae sp. PMI808]|nr:hypothetical protein GQ44DRAFT_203275 [Phaeosphaeriaceae sp. PMI808]
MPVGPYVRPRYPQAPYPLLNGTNAVPTTTTTRNAPAATKPGATSEPQTPTAIPLPSLAPVTVAPFAQNPPTTTTYSSIPKYEGSTAKILQGYCTEPNFTILDGPTALWLPVIGCISSKAECCPTPMTEGAVPEPTQAKAESIQKPNGGAAGGRAAFPISSLPSQGAVHGCPLDYHTVTATSGFACCPSSYWLWSTELGGQTPCYSSLNKALVPPDIPATLAYGFNMTSTSTISQSRVTSDSITLAVFPRPTAPLNPSKQTSAIVNIAYSMQYQLAVEESQPVLKKEEKIGIGIGAAAGGVLIVALIAFLVRMCVAKKRTKTGGYEERSASHRFGSGVDMSRVAHEPAGVARTVGGARYTGVPTRVADH